MNSIISWVGGKKALRDAIVARLDERCDRYVEVFGGGGWVLFHKRPSKFEVYNDIEGELVNFFRVVKNRPAELLLELDLLLLLQVSLLSVRRKVSSFFLALLA